MSDPAKFALHRPEFLNPLLRGEDKIALIMRGTAFKVTAGTTLIEAGTDHAFVYRLLNGWVSRTRSLADGRNQFILIFLPGDLFAVKSMFVTRHPDAVKAISAVVAERVHYKVLHDAYIADSDVATRCIWQVMEEERRLHSWVVGLGQGSAEERLALLLMDFRGRLISAGRVPAGSLVYEMPLTQGQLADHLGVTAIHVNRILKEFRNSGVATVRDGRVVISNLHVLTQRAAPLLDTYERTDAAYTGRPCETLPD
ncbi:MAG: family transcriptional regulator, anaerobic regulatory protein [Gammaproteobacteria bacterium]|jgi:CRP-like cAMP-binding protein|nr:family transcriptional regulator, anaerobic regulatory protein [Gammaproteobacteria bacterium]